MGFEVAISSLVWLAKSFVSRGLDGMPKFGIGCVQPGVPNLREDPDHWTSLFFCTVPNLAIRERLEVESPATFVSAAIQSRHRGPAFGLGQCAHDLPHAR